jgi:peptidoglycan/LPS O-acetylase OafA/YrhL/lysophospholipase L1-like esterase
MSASIETPGASARRQADDVAPSNISRVPFMPGLDGMRALAVVTVMIYHANSDWLKGGFLGVEVFFVISGYLITLLLISEHERDHGVDMKQFWIRRARRLLPALFVMLFALTLWTALFERSTLGKLRGDIVAALGYGSNWYQVYTGQGYSAANDFAPLRHLWSLAVEEQFYLIWPIVMVLLLRVGSRGIANLSRWLFGTAVAITVIVAILYHQGPIGTNEVTPEAYWHVFGRNIAKADFLYLSTFTRAGGLLLGAAFAMIWRPMAIMRGPMRERTVLLDGFGAAGLAVLGLMMWSVGFVGSEGADPLLFRGGFFLSAIATLAVIAAVSHPRTITSKALGIPALVWIGARSYGMYLYHWPIYQLIRNIAGKHMKFHEFVIAIALTLVVTELSYRYIETPIRRGALGAWWKQTRRSRDPGRRKAVLAGAFVGTALAIFGVTSLATAELEQNDVQVAIDAGAEFTCDVLADPSCSGGTTQDPTSSDPATESAPAPLADPTQTAVDPTTTIETTTTTTIPVPIPMLALGDSVMKGAAPPVADLGFTVDAVESRQFKDGVEVAEALKEQGRLGDVVLIHLGTNGTIGAESMQRMMTALADVPRVMILTNDVDKEWTQGNNQLLYDTEATYPNVQLVDWMGLNDACVDDCFASDGLHMNASGADFYANLINQFLSMPL